MKGEIIRVETDDHVELQGILYASSDKSSIGVVHMPGSYGNFYENRFLDALANFYPKNDITFISCNNRGHDGNTAYEIFEDCVLDVKAWLHWLESHEIKRFILQGHSLGTHKVVYYMHKIPNKKVAGCILLAPFDLIAFYRVDSDQVQKRNVQIARELVASDQSALMPREVWDMWPISARTYLNLLGYKTNADLFNFRNDTTRTRGIEALKRLAVPIFVAIGGGDVASLPSPQECIEISSKTSSLHGKVTSHLIPDAPHNFDGHLNELINILGKWLKKNNF